MSIIFNKVGENKLPWRPHDPQDIKLDLLATPPYTMRNPDGPSIVLTTAGSRVVAVAPSRMTAVIYGASGLCRHTLLDHQNSSEGEHFYFTLD